MHFTLSYSQSDVSINNVCVCKNTLKEKIQLIFQGRRERTSASLVWIAIKNSQDFSLIKRMRDQTSTTLKQGKIFNLHGKSNAQRTIYSKLKYFRSWKEVVKL